MFIGRAGLQQQLNSSDLRFMNTRHFLSLNRGRLCPGLFLLACLAGFSQAVAQPTIISIVPTNMASGVSPSAAVVFTFDTAMDTATTEAQFVDYSSGLPVYLTTVPSWNPAGTVLTCTPVPPFPANKPIVWMATGEDTGGFPLTGDSSGFFTTGSGSGGTGSGTNAVTSFTVGKLHSYNQSSTAAPVLDPDAPFAFMATTSLASNRTATAIALSLPTGSISNLAQVFMRPEDYYLYYFTTVSNTLETTFPRGNYVFGVASAQSNQQVTVSLPTTMTQPNAPHLTNYAALQAVNASQPVTLGWDAFSGGTASDFISVWVGDWSSPDYGKPGTVNGTARSVTIPAGVLAANSNYTASVGFYGATWTSNATYTTGAYRATVTHFNLITTGTSAPPPGVKNVSLRGGFFGFDVDTTTGQALTVLYTTDSKLPVTQWQVLLTTNSPGTRVRITDPRPPTSRTVFYRVRNGS